MTAGGWDAIDFAAPVRSSPSPNANPNPDPNDRLRRSTAYMHFSGVAPAISLLPKLDELERGDPPKPGHDESLVRHRAEQPALLRCGQPARLS
eukprot:scaffold40647_cov53-Phaeocystis_antarctica.AAC.4